MLAPLERENRKTIAVDPVRKRWGRRSVRATLAVVAAGVATAVIGWGSSDGSLLERMTATAPAGTPIADRAPAVSPVALKPLEPVHASAPASGPGTRVEPAVPTGVVAGAAATPDPAAAGPRRAAGSEPASAAPANQARIRPKPRTGAFAGQAARPARPEASKPRAGKSREDPDIDLVAALIARLDRRGSDPNGAARPSAPPASAGSNRVAVRLQPCSAGRDPVPARRCRRPACAGHRGPVDACPAAPAPKTSQRRGAADVEAG